jgi:hypothetical protein
LGYATLASDQLVESADRASDGMLHWREETAMHLGKLRAISASAWHSKIESTVRYQGIDVVRAIEIAEKIDI